MKKTILLLCILLLIPITLAYETESTTLEHTIILSGGGQNTSNTDYEIESSISQLAIQEVSNPTYNNQLGFWLSSAANNLPLWLTIPNQEWNEDSILTINLTQYISDLDNDNLSYISTQPNSITITINNLTNIATLNPTPNWYGIRWIIFTADDTKNTINSNNVTLTIINVADGFCGDKICIAPIETCRNCKEDCGACPTAGASGGSTGSGTGYTRTPIAYAPIVQTYTPLQLGQELKKLEDTIKRIEKPIRMEPIINFIKEYKLLIGLVIGLIILILLNLKWYLKHKVLFGFLRRKKKKKETKPEEKPQARLFKPKEDKKQEPEDEEETEKKRPKIEIIWEDKSEFPTKTELEETLAKKKKRKYY